MTTQRHAARLDYQNRAASCGDCEVPLTRLAWRAGGLRPVFSGEWREGDDGVWRLTSYARAQRRRREVGAVSASLTTRRYPPWTEPALWKPVVPALPCAVECTACGCVQLIRG